MKNFLFNWCNKIRDREANGGKMFVAFWVMWQAQLVDKDGRAFPLGFVNSIRFILFATLFRKRFPLRYRLKTFFLRLLYGRLRPRMYPRLCEYSDPDSWLNEELRWMSKHGL